MNANDIGEISAWLTTQGLKGTDEMDIVNGFCQRARAVGMRLDRGLALIDTLHPVYEGRAFQWDSKEPVRGAFEYGPTNEGVSAENWERSAFFHLRENNESEIRRRIGFGDPIDFFGLDTLVAAGHQDFIAMIHRFAQDSHIGDMDCFYSQWTTMDAGGFRDDDIAALRQLVPVLALAIKSGSLTRISRTIAEVYLGEDAAKQVLEGRISRGKAERISAVLWFSDLQNYTRISDNLAPDEIIPFLNDYADAVISSIHEAGGNVLKLIGDGTLAIFKAEEREDACARALVAEKSLREKLKGLNQRRMLEGRPVTEVYLGLHIGDVFYGNIGSSDRLDFTVIGPAVNEVSRIASMCRFIDRSVIMSSQFVAAAPPPRGSEVVSIGRYALRGVKRAQELFTLLPLDVVD
ncbi:MAG TPA: adenylate/guanylate cyclase domain-containing protein [Pararhizobium sp.]|uniref:adenylate/guanylate cyclase domain-containing protein n=1 Tax=Pararhizobium sp. TaxID=1977563 RepID=UPI002BE7E07A|nr:adenylate/guanylate cyclase domain-containing protein [Pararhizobium sp.]HTO30032.1 adenylate/guanylate cyclase domain-containing protein [Pararhizobium sp.]